MSPIGVYMCDELPLSISEPIYNPSKADAIREKPRLKIIPAMGRNPPFGFLFMFATCFSASYLPEFIIASCSFSPKDYYSLLFRLQYR
jgi:hypothetical protein